MQRKLERILDECLARIKEGERLEDCLRRYPQYRDELRSLLCTALLVKRTFDSRVERYAPSEDALARIRDRFMAEVDRRGSHENPRQVDSIWQRYFGWFLQPFRSKCLHIVVMIFLLLMGILGGGVMASADSLPGDALYGVKRASERVCLFLTFDEEARVELVQRYRERREKEIKEVLAQGRSVEIAFEGAVEAVQDDIVVVSGIPMALNSEADVHSPAIGTRVQVLAETQGDGTISARVLTLRGQHPLVASTELRDERPTSEPSHKVSEPTWTPKPSRTDTPVPTPTDLPTEEPEMAATAVDRAKPTETRYVVPSFTPSPTATSLSTATATPVASPSDMRLCIEGVIEEIGDDYWTVAGVRFELGGMVLMDEEHAQAQVGGWATVDAVKKPDGRIIAHSIEVLLAPEQPPQLKEIEGIIESMDEKVWIIAGYRVLITPQTVIEGTPEAGAMVHVEAKEYADGRIVAKGITVESEAEHVIQFEGFIQSMEEGHWTVAGQEIVIDDETHIEGTPAMGDIAEVEAVVREDGSQVARSIRVEAAASPDPSATPTSEPSPTKPVEEATDTPDVEAEGDSEGMSEKVVPE